MTDLSPVDPGQTLGPVLARQLVRALDSLEEAIRQCDDALWRSVDGGREGWGVARQAYHAAESVDYYSRPKPEEFVLFRRLGSNWDEDPVERLPSREDVLAYLAEVRAGALRYLAALAPGSAVLETAVYNLRHLQHHVGQINLRLRLAGREPAAWR